MVVCAEVDSVLIGYRGSTRPFALEGGERSARMRGDPDVNHGDADAGENRTRRAVALSVEHTGHDRPTFGVVAEAQVVVYVPLHQRPGEIGELRIVDGHSDVGHEHRRHERLGRTLHLEHQRLGGGRIEELAVDDEATIHQVFVPGRFVADGDPTLSDRLVVVGPTWEFALGGEDEFSGAGLLFGRHSGYATDVDPDRRVVRPRPVAGVVVGSGTAGGLARGECGARRRVIVTVTRGECGARRRVIVTVTRRRGARVMVGARGVSAAVVVHVSGAVPHSDHHGEADGRERKCSVE